MVTLPSESGTDPFAPSPNQLPNGTVQIEGNQIPVNLRTMMYVDAKKAFMLISRYLFAAVVVILVYVYFGAWGILSFGVMFAIFYQWMIPKIATKFMSWINLVSIELHVDKADGIKALQVPYARFERALKLDSAGNKATLNAPFESALGPAYLIDEMIMDFQPMKDDPSVVIDIIVVHNIHKNTDFANDYVPEFLKLREHLVTIMKENFALKANLPVMIEKGFIDKLNSVLSLIDSVVFSVDEIPTADQYKKLQAEVLELQKQIGIDMENTKHFNIVEGMYRAYQPLPEDMVQ